jgi:predicted nucleic acid-binding protein
LAINGEVWHNPCELADRYRKAGKRAPVNDLLITACARYHGVEVESADAHFDFFGDAISSAPGFEKSTAVVLLSNDIR